MSPCGFTLHFLPSVFGHVFWLTGRQSFVPSSNFLCVLLHTFHSNMPSFINHLFRYCFLNIVFCVFHKHVLSIWHIYCYLYFYSHMLYFYYINLFLLSKGLALYQLSLSVLLQPWCESVPIPFNSLCPTCKDRQPPPPPNTPSIPESNSEPMPLFLLMIPFIHLLFCFTKSVSVRILYFSNMLIPVHTYLQ